MRASPALLSCMLVVVGCGANTAVPSGPFTRAAGGEQGTFGDATRGLRVHVPPGWRVSPRILTPSLANPREILAMGTGPMPADVGGNMPTRTMRHLGADDVFLSVQERSVGIGRPELDRLDAPGPSPPRPDHFRFRTNPSWSQDEQGTVARGARFWWREFADGDRRLYLLVGMGSHASSRRRSQVEAVADSLQFAPGETWGSGPWVRIPHGWTISVRDDAPTVRTITLVDPEPPALTIAVRLTDRGRFAGRERTIAVRATRADLVGPPRTLHGSFGGAGRAEVTVTPASPVPDGDRDRRVNALNQVLESIRVTSS